MRIRFLLAKRSLGHGLIGGAGAWGIAAACALLIGSSAPLLSGQAAAGSDEPAGFVLWKDAHLKEAADRLYAKIGDKKMVFETVGNWKGHSIYLVLRGATDDPEFHETEKDLYVALRGTATLVVGGELVDERKTPRKQRRGSSIRGGVKRELAPGDILHISESTPHQLLIHPGEPFLYLLAHFDEEPLLKP